MATDLQIIDGFEQLRERYAQRAAASPRIKFQPPGADLTPRERVTRAWIAVRIGPGAGPAHQRRMRAIARAILEPERDGTQALTAEDEQILARGKNLPEALDRAGRKGLWPLANVDHEGTTTSRTPLEEVRLWARLLPGLHGLRVWRFLHHLGRPLIVPDAPVRRFLWRLGLLEQMGAKSSPDEVFSGVEQIRRLTGMEIPLLDELIRWHSTHDRDETGGGLCGHRPRCGDCPLRRGCSLARFHPPAGGKTDAAPEGNPVQPIRRQVATGKIDALGELELLAVSLAGMGPGIRPMALAEQLMARFGSIRALRRTPVRELASVRGMTETRATTLKAALELGYRLSGEDLEPGQAITSSSHLWYAYRHRFRDLPQEHFVIVLLDAKHRIMHDHIVSKGSLTGSLAHPREVFAEAIRHAAAAVILLHNHPSGDPSPSPEDRGVTTRLREAGDILGVRVLDHIILGRDSYYSFRDEED